MTDDGVSRTNEVPDSELGRLSNAMLQVMHDHGDEEVRAIVMLHKGDKGITALGNYEHDGDGDLGAIQDLFMYLKYVMQANGQDMVILPMQGPSPS